MRVISGEKKGLLLKALEGQETRPTLDRVKESLFSSIQFDIAGSIALDLFAGSGALGIEALSRGALSCAFVDESKAACRVIQENLSSTGLLGSGTIECTSFDAFLNRQEGILPHTLIFLDPPYGRGLVQKALALLSPIVKKDTIIVAEFEKSAIMDDNSGFFLQKTLHYRINEIAILIKK